MFPDGFPRDRLGALSLPDDQDAPRGVRRSARHMSFIIIDALLVSALHVAAGFQLMLYGLPDLCDLLTR